MQASAAEAQNCRLRSIGMATMITPFRAAFQLLLKYPEQSSSKRGTFDLGLSLWVRHQSNVLATRLDAFDRFLGEPGVRCGDPISSFCACVTIVREIPEP
jgi:hypothetical protein